MNTPSLPALWPAPGNLSEGRAFVLKEDVIFTPLGQEGSLCWLNARLPSSGGSFIIATAVSDEEEASATRLLRNESVRSPPRSTTGALHWFTPLFPLCC